ncbi:MAG: TIGR01244 family sulfur transferase [Pseudomonadota bacterium]|nr:TIGR01244 family phosphatase [Sphingomonas sp.]MDQ3483221.1 TIGR01244 family sulfur transferase [Pseudomonadota bacterium]
MIRQLDEKTLVSGQISAGDVAQLKTSGVTMIVNNRPDGEDPGQPEAGEIEAAAEAAGVAYRFIPIRRGIGPSDVEAMQEAIASCDGKLLAFCRSGNRSALAWAVARREQGASVEELQQAAQNAGIDLTPVAHLL